MVHINNVIIIKVKEKYFFPSFSNLLLQLSSSIVAINDFLSFSNVLLLFSLSIVAINDAEKNIIISSFSIQ